jgi:hypothetical protein
MSNRKIAAILALIGIVSLLSMMVVHWIPRGVDALSYLGAASLALAAIVFLADVIAKSWREARRVT